MQQQPGGDAAAAGALGDDDVRHVRLVAIRVGHEPQTGVADELTLAAGDDVVAARVGHLFELALEHVTRPGRGVRGLLDREHLAEVATVHRRDVETVGIAAVGARQEARQHAHGRASRTDQLICASGARRYTGSISFGRTHSSRRAFAWASCTSAPTGGCTGCPISQR